jgi:SAM-dependent methyltransferase
VHGYEDDLAYIHDAGFVAVAEAGAATLVKLLARRGLAGGLVVELGCGSGASSRLLTDAGHDVLGLDASPAMLELARRRAPRARFRVGSFVDAELPPCDAVTALGEVLNYLFDERASERVLGDLFARVHAALRPGGVFLLDLAGPGRGRDRGWTAGAGWAVLHETEEDERTRVLTRRITTFREAGGAYRRGEEEHRQRLYAPTAVAELLRAAGFRVRVRRGYGDRRLAPNVRAFVATKGRLTDR